MTAVIDLKNELGQLSWKFVSHSFRVFVQMNSSLKGESGLKDQMPLQGYSKLFRSAIIERFADELKIVINNLDALNFPNAVISLFDNFLDKIYSVEQFWHLCELFLFGSEDKLLIEAISWLKVLITEYNTEHLITRYSTLTAQTIYVQSRAADISEMLTKDGYWDIVYGLALQGQLENVWLMLEIHPDIQELSKQTSERVNSNPLHKELHQIFTSFPYNAYFNPVSDCSIERCKLNATMKEWKGHVVSVRELLLHNKVGVCFTNCAVEFVENLMGILCGDMAILQNRCDSWVELSLSMILFVYNTSPKFTYSAFSSIINESMKILAFQESDER